MESILNGGRDEERRIERGERRKRNLKEIKTNKPIGYNYRSAIIQGYGQVVEDADEKLVWISLSHSSPVPSFIQILFIIHLSYHPTDLAKLSISSQLD